MNPEMKNQRSVLENTKGKMAKRTLVSLKTCEVTRANIQMIKFTTIMYEGAKCVSIWGCQNAFLK